MLHYEIIDAFKTKDIFNQRIAFELPLNHSNPESHIIQVVINITQKYSDHISKLDAFETIALPEEPKLIAYLQGGPGFPCATPTSNSSVTKLLLDKNYQILWLDQRGTGYSTPIQSKNFREVVNNVYGDSELNNQLRYILSFRADSVVKDLEMIRKFLIKDEKLSIIGQSYGGFCCFTYLSLYPKSLKEVLVTGGIPPIGFAVDDVYEATYKQTSERNWHYYNKFPQDRTKIVSICKYLKHRNTSLPNGSHLTPERFLQLGLNFGATGGTDTIHLLVTKLYEELKVLGQPTYNTLNTISQSLGFETNVIYAVFQEAIYCNGVGSKSNWSADFLRESKFEINDDEIYFTGEMVYKFMYENNSYSELAEFKDLAHALHEYTNWSNLYDVDVLKNISWKDVPIVAATYVNDQYVDFNLCKQVKEKYFAKDNLKQYITSEFFHNGLRADPDKVLGSLFDLLENNDID
ncbi:unnamed protein product [Candida verbasci]|uniref:AB hydrolase-1 domain-containing protein n=1 Tax=Candida verbasci TaxID=1227364 RepID=A0A9W4TYD7_9ASCO|nr:unnamed protein product [Candida verbasci]